MIITISYSNIINKEYSTKENNSVVFEKKDTISIIGVGDIMLGTNYLSSKYLPPNDGKYILSNVKDILNDADITFGNLEGVLLTGDAPAKKCQNPEHCYAFKSPDHYINYIKDAGFDVLSIANNHISDFGEIGKKNTTKLLRENSIYFSGLNDYKYTIFEKNNIKYGFCAFAASSGTLCVNDYKTATSIVNHLDSLCDIVLVSMHIGAEGSNHRNITRENEIFLDEDRGNPYMFARLVIDAGADIVFGHGPHVTRAVDLYKGKFIAYSLGNFATYGRFNLSGVSGVAPILKVFVNNKGEFINAKVTSTKQLKPGGSLIDTTNAALKEIINLTKMDIPESDLIINLDGLILKK